MGDAAVPTLGYVQHSDRTLPHQLHPTGRAPGAFTDVAALQTPSKLLQISALSPVPLNGLSSGADERTFWQASKPIQLTGREYVIFQRYVTGVSRWIDLFDPQMHFSTYVPHLALQNEGLMKAVLALGARHLSIKPDKLSEVGADRTAALQYYYETLHYLGNAMRYTSFKNSIELLATTVVVSTYEMIDGAGSGWERKSSRTSDADLH